MTGKELCEKWQEFSIAELEDFQRRAAHDKRPIPDCWDRLAEWLNSREEPLDTLFKRPEMIKRWGSLDPVLQSAPSIQVIDDPVGPQADPLSVEKWASMVAARLGKKSWSALHVRVDRNLNPVACTCQSHFTECPLFVPSADDALKMRLLEERAAAFVPTPESASPKLTWRRTVPWIMQEPDTSAPVDVELPIRHECTCGEGTVKHFPDCPLA